MKGLNGKWLYFCTLTHTEGLLWNRGAFYVLKFTLRYKKQLWGTTSYGDAAATEHEITDISLGRGDGCLLFMEVTRRLKRRGEARLHGAVRRLSGLCLVGSWQTATKLTDWLSERWNNRKSLAKLRDSRRGGGQANAACHMNYVDVHNELTVCIHPSVCSCAFVWPQVVRITSCVHHKNIIKEKLWRKYW